MTSETRKAMQRYHQTSRGNPPLPNYLSDLVNVAPKTIEQPVDCMVLPRAMVLVFEPRLSCAVWEDYVGQHRTLTGLEKRLKQGVKGGEWVAWRLMRIEKEVIGNVD